MRIRQRHQNVKSLGDLLLPVAQVADGVILSRDASMVSYLEILRPGYGFRDAPSYGRNGRSG